MATVTIEAGWVLAVLAAWSVLTWLAVPILGAARINAARRIRRWQDRRLLRRYEAELGPADAYEEISGGGD